ncbi:transglycosylase domain-containing protein [Helcobacillus massiliensis]|uniref:transglycosylase domain-containing protein n=1 Tax=Helcobacillus massiliensis TaxID=521392 RepID=UPI002954B41E|nr:transglycosylase domain-containing protein [Helcobacillus massiliensis]WOO92786.1 transglycosylase domain-containing protein [Helcobacillus massiliensis]
MSDKSSGKDPHRPSRAASGSRRTVRTPGSESSGRRSTGAGAAAASTRRTPAGGRRRRAAGTAAAGSAAARPKGNMIGWPRAGKKGLWRWIPSFRLLALVGALLILAGVGVGVWFYNSTDVPEPTDVAVAQTSRVYFSDGTTLMGEFSEIDRTILPSDEIPQNVKDAVVASEDSSFYENRGVSPKGIVRAFVNNVSGGAQQGGSTITQQYVERYHTGTQTGYLGKAREAVMALKIDQELSKDEILSRYLNTIYFGRGAYGIEAAAQAYFNKPAKDLSDSEAAMLVGLIPAPSSWDPAVNEKMAQQRWARVISRQVNDTKTLTEKEADAMEFPEVKKPKKENRFGGTNGYLLAEVKKELEAKGLTPEEIDTGGYHIVSTIDKKKQQYAVDAVNSLPEDRPERNHVGTVTIDPNNGEIVSMYGGKDYITQGRNDATQSRMQAGSIFKTFTLVAALEDGYGLRSRWDGDSPKDIRGWKVKNFGNTSYGRVDLKKATTNSINTAYGQLNFEMGPERTKETAIKLGLPEKTPGLDGDVTNVLGTASPTVREMGEAYATIASGGIYRPSHIVREVKNPDGSVRYKPKDEAKRVLDEGVATNAIEALTGPPSQQGSARRVAQNMDGRPVAGKTGTSEKFHSAWFVGFTPQLVTSVGMFQPTEDGKGSESLTPFGEFDQITGATFPSLLWVDIMKPSLEGEPFMEFPPPGDLPQKQRSKTDEKAVSEQRQKERQQRQEQEKARQEEQRQQKEEQDKKTEEERKKREEEKKQEEEKKKQEEEKKKQEEEKKKQEEEKKKQEEEKKKQEEEKKKQEEERKKREEEEKKTPAPTTPAPAPDPADPPATQPTADSPAADAPGTAPR